MSAPSKILICGAAKAGKKILVQNILNFQDRNESKTDHVFSEIRTQSNFITYTLPITTKYFSTEVQLWLKKSGGAFLGSEVPDDAIKNCDCIILVFDASNPASFDAAVVGWGEFVDRHEPTTLLCIANKIDIASESYHRQRESVYIEWCLDHGFEFIEANCLRPFEGVFTPLFPRYTC